jgi:bacteriorhodopsin
MNLLLHLLIYNLAASILIYGSLAYNPRIWLHRMPPEVRSKVPEKTPEERKLFIGIALPFVLLLFVYPVVYVVREGTTLLVSSGMLFAFFVGFALWDTLVLDLLIFCKFTPRFVIISGTSREDYSNMKYHLVSGAKGLAMSAIFSGLLGPVIALLKNMIA